KIFIERRDLLASSKQILYKRMPQPLLTRYADTITCLYNLNADQLENFMKERSDFVRELSLWPLPETECAFCAHRKCHRCREVSFSSAACCQCRTRAIERLKFLRDRLDERVRSRR